MGGIENGSLRDIDVLVHCAYDFSVLRWNEILEVNVEGSKRLFQAARSDGVRTIVFISTMSAFLTCQSLYGRAKLLIEEEARKVGAFIIRPGLIYDAQSGGMVGSLRASVEKLPVVPLIGSGKQTLYLLHSEDFCRFLQKIAEGKIPAFTEPVTLAHEQGFTFRDILKIIAHAQGKAPLFIPLPSACIYSVLKIAEIMGLRIRMRSDSVRSLVHCDPAPSFSVMRELGFEPRRFSEQTLREGTV
jgi:nucleoside-diphosphate-sugar epimerase